MTTRVNSPYLFPQKGLTPFSFHYDGGRTLFRTWDYGWVGHVTKHVFLFT